jgi:glycogen(starch) synthase
MARILCVTSMYPPHHQGGYEVSCRDVMVRLAERGHDVTVLTADRRIAGVADPAGEREANPAVRRDLRLYYRDDIWAPGPWGRWRIERHNQRAIRDALDAARPDAVTVWHVGALSLGVVTTVVGRHLPVVYGISDDWLTYANQLDRWLTVMRRLGPLGPPLRHLVRVPTVAPDLGPTGVFCFISESTKQRSEEASPWRFPRSTIVYSGIDRTLFTPREVMPPWRGHLLYVGRYDPRKGIETAIRAMAELPGCTLEVQGTGDDAYRAALEALATRLGVSERVAFRRVPRAELPARYGEADVCVFPSEWVEPFGLVPLEAMACGTPVVSTAMGGSAEFLVDGANCLLFPAGDEGALTRAVRRLEADVDLRSSLVRDGYRTAAYFDVERLADSYEAWLAAAARGFAAPLPASRHFSLDTAGAGG